MAEEDLDARQRFGVALGDNRVVSIARRIRASGKLPSLPEILELARALSHACGAEVSAKLLEAELMGYQNLDIEVPFERRALGFASPFPVRALDLGLLDPEEIFLANREKFSQVTLTIGQPIDELESALSEIRQGGVLALKVPAAEVTGDSASTDEDTEVYIYILPREIQKIVEAARARALDTLITRIVEAAADASAASSSAVTADVGLRPSPDAARSESQELAAGGATPAPPRSS